MSDQNLLDRLEVVQAHLDETLPAGAETLREFREEYGRVLLALDAARAEAERLRGESAEAFVDHLKTREENFIRDLKPSEIANDWIEIEFGKFPWDRIMERFRAALAEKGADR